MNELVVRLYDAATDSLPPELLADFALLGDMLDPEWVWVMESAEGVVAASVGAPLHGVLLLLRIASTDSAPPMWPRVFLSAVFDDARSRGLKGVLTMLDPTRDPERRLARLLVRSGGHLSNNAVVFGFANFEEMTC